VWLEMCTISAKVCFKVFDVNQVLIYPSAHTREEQGETSTVHENFLGRVFGLQFYEFRNILNWIRTELFQPEIIGGQHLSLFEIRNR